MLECTNKTVLFIIYVIVYATWCFIRGKEKSPFVLLFDPGGFLIITHLFLLPFCQFPNFEHFESKHNEKREKFDRYVCEEFAFGSKNWMAYNPSKFPDGFRRVLIVRFAWPNYQHPRFPAS